MPFILFSLLIVAECARLKPLLGVVSFEFGILGRKLNKESTMTVENGGLREDGVVAGTKFLSCCYLLRK